MKLLTDGTEKDPILAFCKAVISRHAENWPPKEEVFAEEFVGWLGVRSFMTRSLMVELCSSKGIKLSFATVPPELRGFNCSFQYKKEIVLAEEETIVFSDLHTLLHEFREMLECGFADLGYSTLTAKDSLELKADEFAMIRNVFQDRDRRARIPRIFRNGCQNRDKLATLFWLCVAILMFCCLFA
jgi:hypothetical protein